MCQYDDAGYCKTIHSSYRAILLQPRHICRMDGLYYNYRCIADEGYADYCCLRGAGAVVNIMLIAGGKLLLHTIFETHQRMTIST